MQLLEQIGFASILLLSLHIRQDSWCYRTVSLDVLPGHNECKGKTTDSERGELEFNPFRDCIMYFRGPLDN
jgi:hypothetical protein